MVVTKRQLNFVLMLLGVWLLVSPWVLRSPWAAAGSAFEDAAANSYLMGAAIALVAATPPYVPTLWKDLINAGMGVWLVISPYALGFASETTVTVNTVAAGVVAVGLALWAMLRATDFRKRWHA